MPFYSLDFAVKLTGFDVQLMAVIYSQHKKQIPIYLESALGVELKRAAEPQLAGALGAAIIAGEILTGRK